MQAVSIDSSLGATYLASRGIAGLHGNKIRNTLRFHPVLYHVSSKQTLPAFGDQKAMQCGCTAAFLRPDRTGKSEVPSNKMVLGPTSGGAVRFGRDQQIIVLAESIETALSISCASQLTVWATQSTSELKGLIPAPLAEVTVICADHDGAGLAAAETIVARHWLYQIDALKLGDTAGPNDVQSD